jgi:hypothetical protein
MAGASPVFGAAAPEALEAKFDDRATGPRRGNVRPCSQAALFIYFLRLAQAEQSYFGKCSGWRSAAAAPPPHPPRPLRLLRTERGGGGHGIAGVLMGELL